MNSKDRTEVATMIARVAMATKDIQEKTIELSGIAVRLNILQSKEPVDQFRDKLADADIAKLFAKTKTLFDKAFAEPTTTKK